MTNDQLPTEGARSIDDEVRRFIDAIDPARRPLFDRIHRLILDVHPDVSVLWSYQMPTYELAGFRLYVGVWKHGLSFYGWQPDRDGGFSERHPSLVTSKGTIKLDPGAAAGITDQEFHDLFRAALGG